ncbi:MAG: 16S rRNA (cytosine(1402)-N(4))-methyltransferase RsmH [Candidatus Nanopelagicales bacterium]|jgi:16S rRNA (cytosine1402-N4)-methyltransferase|nr:16S rRNA (cytosine(1402)-N(4))-methyltransferase RsmH [Candidatus Nanopelagicales bacterium]
MEQRHVPVALPRVLELLTPVLLTPGDQETVMVDATTGLGGHSAAVLQRFPNAQVVGLDRDPQAVAAATERLGGFTDRARVVHARYDQMSEVLDDLHIDRVDAVLFDLGVSSMQIDEPDRGFAYSRTAPLDMRMDTDAELTADEVLNTYSQSDLARVLWEYGEERFARRIAREIVARRPLRTSDDLVAAVEAGVPAAARRKGHPAKRTFQAIRIEVNGELASLAAALPQALRRLRPGGRIVVLSYHSLEDKMVKQALRRGAEHSAPAGLPVIPADSRPWLRLITRGSEVASEQEIAVNPRARSVRIRAAEKLREAS